MTEKLTCNDCRYYNRGGQCTWACANFAPAWVNPAQAVSPDTGAECDCWEETTNDD